MRKSRLGLILLSLFAASFLMCSSLAKPSAIIFFDNFSGKKLSGGWNVEINGGASYTVGHSILTLSSTGQPYDSVTIYRDFVPKTDKFTLSAKVKATTLGGFALRLHASALPIFGSIEGAQLEFDNGIGGKNFMAVWKPLGGGWTWTNIYQPVTTEVWFILELTVQRNPFSIRFSLYNSKSTLLGTTTITSIGFGYGDIRYVCLEVWSGPNAPIYNVDWIRIN